MGGEGTAGGTSRRRVEEGDWYWDWDWRSMVDADEGTASGIEAAVDAGGAPGFAGCGMGGGW